MLRGHICQFEFLNNTGGTFEGLSGISRNGAHMLTDTSVKNAKTREKAYKLSDERGLYLLVKPNGAKL